MVLNNCRPITQSYGGVSRTCIIVASRVMVYHPKHRLSLGPGSKQWPINKQTVLHLKPLNRRMSTHCFRIDVKFNACFT